MKPFALIGDEKIPNDREHDPLGHRERNPLGYRERVPLGLGNAFPWKGNILEDLRYP